MPFFAGREGMTPAEGIERQAFQNNPWAQHAYDWSET